MTGLTERGAALAQKVAEYITEHPDEWDQDKWACGTKACFGGRAMILTGLGRTEMTEWGYESLVFVHPDSESGGFSETAGQLLGLDWDNAYSLFYDPWEYNKDKDGDVIDRTPLQDKVRNMWQKLTELYGDKITTPEEYR